MGWKMPNAVVVAVTAVLLLVTAETVLAAIAAADGQQGVDSGDNGGIERIKSSILNKLGMQRPPEFGDRLPPRVPTDLPPLPPLQDLMRMYNRDHSGSVVVLPHIRHKSHHLDDDDSATDIQSDEATG